MMRVGHADLRISHAALLMAHHQRDDASKIALVREYLEIEHQLHMVFPQARDTRRVLDYRHLLMVCFRDLDPSLYAADSIQIFRELGAVPLWKLALEMRD